MPIPTTSERPAGAAVAHPLAHPAFALCFAFLCLLPYPALPLGGATGLQASQAVALLAAPALLLVGLPHRQLLAYALLVAAMVASANVALLSGRVLAGDVLVGATIALALAYVVLIPSGVLATAARLPATVAGVALAIILHVGVGAFQAYSFARETFPLLWIYQNPDFLSVATVAEDYALWIRRPFGLFPEPSAMAASIGPWLVLFTGLLLAPGPRPGRPQPNRLLLAVATVGGTVLVVLSQSGYTVVVFAAAMPILLHTAWRRVGGAVTGPAHALVVGLVLVPAFVAAVLATRAQLAPRLDVQQNESWQARGQSIVLGLTVLGPDLGSFLFGVGPGQSHLVIARAAVGELLPEWFRPAAVEPVVAVWSVAVVWYTETGLIGATTIATLLVMVLRAVLRSTARVVGLSALGAWLFGVVLATSYFSLSSLWLFLGLLLAWDRVFPPPGTPVVRPRPAPIVHPSAVRP